MSPATPSPSSSFPSGDAALTGNHIPLAPSGSAPITSQPCSPANELAATFQSQLAKIEATLKPSTHARGTRKPSLSEQEDQGKH